MMPISEKLWWLRAWLDKYTPAIIGVLVFTVIWLLLFVPRVIVCLLLPADSTYEWHKPHKVKKFWGFE